MAARVPVRLWIQAGEPIAADTQDLSISGAFVRTPVPVALGARIEVEMSLPEGPGARAERIAGYIIRTTSSGVGIEWRELAPTPVRVLLAARASLPPYRLCADLAHEPARAAALTVVGTS